MTKEDIIRMAREANIKQAIETPRLIMVHELERFAAIVSKHAAAAEREACAKLVWPTQQIKVWSDEELTAMTSAFNRAQEKHGWYETIMAVGAAALKHQAAAIRARSEQ